MFERFTNRARRVVVLAQDEARLLKHNYIGTEHLLLGLVKDGEGIAAQALEALDISLEAVREQVEQIIGLGQNAPSGGHIPFTPRAKKALELSLREAMKLGVNYIGTEHILLGLIREGNGVAAKVLIRLGGDLSTVRDQVIALSPGNTPEAVEMSEEASIRIPLPARAGIPAKLQEISDRLANIEAHLGISRSPAPARVGPPAPGDGPGVAGDVAGGQAPAAEPGVAGMDEPESGSTDEAQP